MSGKKEETKVHTQPSLVDGPPPILINEIPLYGIAEALKVLSRSKPSDILFHLRSPCNSPPGDKNGGKHGTEKCEKRFQK
jgi:hypothetical protein